MRILTICIIIVGASIAYCQEPIVAIGARGEGPAMAVAYNGDLYQGSFSHGIEWKQKDNIFESAGFEQQANIAGYASQYWLGTEPFAIDEIGNVFSQEMTHGIWSYDGNLAEITGHDPSGIFVSMTSFEQGIRVMAVTENGDSYMHVHNGEWSYEGNLFEISGVIPAEKRSLGDLKSLFK